MIGPAEHPVGIGDPVPSFTAATVAGGSVSLHVDAGRWVVLVFPGALGVPAAERELTALIGAAAFFREPHLVAYVVLSEPPPPEAAALLMEASGPSFAAVADYDGAIAARFGAAAVRHSLVLDPMQRMVAAIPFDHPDGHAAVLGRVLRDLPPVDQSAGVPLWAPALIVPRVLDFELCDLLVRLYDRMGGEPSGFLVDRDGQTFTVLDHRLKSRRDLNIVAPQLREAIRGQVVRRLVPAVARFFSFAATRMDRYLVSCYAADTGGHFFRHRDNLNAGAEHRRFAVSINLTSDYDGCDLVFPEFGTRSYRAPVAGAVVFSCGMLHEVTPITRGRRLAFLPFLYGEADAVRREANNSRLHESSAVYVGGSDRLYPDGAAAGA